MAIEILRQEHRNIEKLLLVLERELEVFTRGGHPDYEVVHAVIAYFRAYPDTYHHPLEDLVFSALKVRIPAVAANIGDLAADHRRGAERLRQVGRAVESALLADQKLPRQNINDIIHDFIAQERRHMAMEEHNFFPAAIAALQPLDWADVAAKSADLKNPIFSEIVEARFEIVRKYISELEQEAEAKRTAHS